MSEPLQFGQTIANALANAPVGSKRRPVLEAMAAAHRRNQARRRAVLSHDDLRSRIEAELGYGKADQWNGYMPPATWNRFSDDELCVSPAGRLTQTGHRALGEMANASPRRALMVELSQVARDRYLDALSQEQEAG